MDTSEAAAAAQNTQGKPEQHASSNHAIDKYALARIAKRKQKRKAHRAKLRASNTNG